MDNPDRLGWKADWPLARQAFVDWWEHRGLALWLAAPRDQPWEISPAPAKQTDPQDSWTNTDRWARNTIHEMARYFYGGVAFPSFWTCMGGPGSLGLFLGAIGHPAPDTLWYEPVITNPELHPSLRLDHHNEWWQRQVELLRIANGESRGRYLVGLPDLIENLDTLAQLRDSQLLLVDLVERPDWVHAKLAEINAAYFAAYDELGSLVRDPWGGSTFTAFALWGPGRVAKIQCDFSCMISTDMFRDFVVPHLTAQCEWLDYSLYHLDGTQAFHQLDAILAIEPLDAVEWTPQAGLPGGGHQRWYELYRRIKAAGKSVQAIGVKPEEIEPLIDAVGAEGLYIMSGTNTEPEARALLCRVGWKGDA